MAITGITISQSNIEDNCNLLSIHNQLVFISDVAYTGEAPELVNVDILDSSDTVLDTFSAIPYNDIAGARQFAFIANDILKSYMGSIDDFRSNEKVLEYVDGITKEFTIKFYDPSTSATFASVNFIAMQAARQFGESPCLIAISNNVNETYYGAVGMPVYVYFYNKDASNVISIGTGEITMLALLDYDDVYFYDFDDSKILAL